MTIPAAIQARLGPRPKDRVRFAVVGDEVTLKPAGSQLLAGFGAVNRRTRLEDWRIVEDEAERLLAAEVAAEG